MKRATLIIIGIFCLWAAAWGSSQWLGMKQGEMRRDRVQRILERMEEDPVFRGSPRLRSRLEGVVPRISSEPALLRSYETMLSLPDDPRAFWIEEIDLASGGAH